VPQRAGGQEGLGWWVAQYFQHAVTTSPASQQVQRRDLGLFLRYLQTEEGTDQRLAWTPRLVRAFQQHLRQTLTPEGRRTWSDKTIQRILAHLKTFATWVHAYSRGLEGPWCAESPALTGPGRLCQDACTL
jgi:site-specific recombinase XerD